MMKGLDEMPLMPRTRLHIAEGFDLSEAFSRFPKNDPKYGPIIQALHALESAVSAHKDLLEAQEAINACASLNVPEGLESMTDVDLVKAEAIFVHALLLYCRAVHSGSKERNRYDVLGCYTSEQLAAHREVTKLRDSVIAHYGKGKDLSGGSWNKDHVVLWRGEGRFSYSYPSMRAATKARHAQSLAGLIEASAARMSKYASERQDRLMEILKRSLSTDKELYHFLEAYRFDEVRFFGRQMPQGTSKRYAVEATKPPNETPS